MRPFERSLTIIGVCGGAALAVYGATKGSPWWILGLLIVLFGAIVLWTAKKKN